MFNFDVEVIGPEAHAHAHALAAELAGTGRTTIVPLRSSRSPDPVTVIVVSAAGIQSVDIVYRFHRRWQYGQDGAHARPAVAIILPDGVRIPIGDTDPGDARILVRAHQ